jgi:hypothetical protein
MIENRQKTVSVSSIRSDSFRTPWLIKKLCDFAPLWQKNVAN